MFGVKVTGGVIQSVVDRARACGYRSPPYDSGAMPSISSGAAGATASSASSSPTAAFSSATAAFSAALLQLNVF